MKGLNKKVIILFVLILVLAIFIYGFFFKGSSSVSTGALVSTQAQIASVSQQNAIGKELLASLNQLRSLILDTSVFDGAAFKSLQSFNVELQPEITGRVNPFLPINSADRQRATTTRR